MMKYLAMRFNNVCSIYDLRQEKQIFSHNLGQRGWISISADGQTFACGDTANILAVKYNPEESKFVTHYNTTLNEESMCGRLDPTGRYLWILFKSRLLGEIDLSIKDFINAAELKFDTRAGRSAAEDATIGGKEVIDLYDTHTCIPTCTANKCVCFHDQYINIVCIDNDEYWSIGYVYRWGSERIIAISRDENYLLTLGGKYQYPYCHIDKLGKHCELDYVGHSYIYDLKCVNSNHTLGLRSDKKRIISITSQIKQYEVPDGGYGGINKLSSSLDGSEVSVSYGKNILHEHHIDIMRITSLEKRYWTPPFNDNTYRFIRSLISPNGAVCILGSSGLSKASELLLYDLQRDTLIDNKALKKDMCLDLCYSTDSHFVIAMYGTGPMVHDDQNIYVVSTSGKILNNIIISNDYDWDAEEGGYVLSNNKYYITFSPYCKFGDNYSGCLIFDLTGSYQQNSKPISAHHIHTWAGHVYKPLFAIDAQWNYYANDPKSDKLFLYSLITQAFVYFDCSLIVAGISPTGRILYLTDSNHTLYKSRLPLEEHFEPLLKHVKWIVTALDEAHIFVITDDNSILLFNIETKKVEQYAYCGNLCFHLINSSKGLYTANTFGGIFLFKPDERFHVNIPAVTSFIRRWNLETKEQEEPTAVCPMCGHQFGMSEELSHIITEIPSEIKYTDWDNPQLKGHVCPHCGAQLQFNPYIT